MACLHACSKGMLSLHHVIQSLPPLRCRPIASSQQQQHEQHQQHIASNRIRVLSLAQHSPLLRRAHHYHHPRLVAAVAAATEEEGGGSGRRRRRRGVRMAAASTSPQSTGTAESAISFEPPGMGKKRTPLEMTHLEGNSWLWEVAGLQILVDPVLVGNLDFGIPFLYDAAKKSKLMKEYNLDDLPPLDCILITQGLDDHCHKKTLQALVKRFSDVRVIASPNAKSIISDIGYTNIVYLEPSDSTMLGDIKIRATAGPVLGPPWQRPENGYFLEVREPDFVLYYEPHCVFEQAKLEHEHADVIVTPVVKQVLPGYTLVSGQDDAVQLAKILQPKSIVIMKNGDLESRGVLSWIVVEKGTVQSFKSLLHKSLPDVEVLEPEPGVPLQIPF
ncbi:unnamed protein product [Sphagnum balticum]